MSRCLNATAVMKCLFEKCYNIQYVTHPCNSIPYTMYFVQKLWYYIQCSNTKHMLQILKPDMCP